MTTTTTTERPYLIGVYTDGQGDKFLPLTELEIDRTMLLYRSIFDACEIPTRSCAILITHYRDSALDLPIERAMVADGIIPCHCEAISFDASRVESFIRLMKPPAVFGVNNAILDGLETCGHDLEGLFRGRLVWARGEEAYQRLHKLNGFTALRWMEVGPAPAIECPHGGGMHIDEMEWQINQDAEGEIYLTSRRPRALVFNNEPAGLKATLNHQACACGISGPRITPL